MSDNNGITPFEYIKEVRHLGAGSTQGGTINIYVGSMLGVSFHNQWNRNDGGNQTLAATILIEASNDPLAEQTADPANALWEDVTTEYSVTNPTSGANTQMINVSNQHYGFIRMKVTYVSGDGLFRCFFCARGVGS